MHMANKFQFQSAQSLALVPARQARRPPLTRVFSFFNPIFSQERLPSACSNCILMQMEVHTKTVQYVLLLSLLVAISDLSIQYIRLPPAYVPYILRVSIEAGTPAARNGVFKTNFPLDGGTFGRDRFAERRYTFAQNVARIYSPIF
jgi:N-terminal domain from the human glycogen debranching enzyme